MKKPHIHADVIKAWADGAEIQSKFDEPEEMYYGQNSWALEPFPDWDPLVLYRVRPEPRPNFVVHAHVEIVLGELIVTESPPNNLSLTYNSDTGKLIGAEVLK
jgi:hypothetical protein